MACVTDDGYIVASARKLLESIRSQALTANEIAKKADLPLFKVRSSLRELKESGFVTEKNDTYIITAAAEEILDNK